MTDALTTGQTAEAVRRWRQLVASDPSSEFRAVTWLALWLEKATRALAMKRMRINSFTIAKELKIWPAQNADKLLMTVDRLGDDFLADAAFALDQHRDAGARGLGGDGQGGAELRSGTDDLVEAELRRQLFGKGAQFARSLAADRSFERGEQPFGRNRLDQEV